MLGHLEEWFYAGLAGIQPDPASPGFRHFFLRPQAVGDLEWVEASYKSPQGMIKSAWRRNGDEVEYTFQVPAGSTATAVLSGTTVELSPGVKHLRARMRTG